MKSTGLATARLVDFIAGPSAGAGASMAAAFDVSCVVPAGGSEGRAKTKHHRKSTDHGAMG